MAQVQLLSLPIRSKYRRGKELVVIISNMVYDYRPDDFNSHAKNEVNMDVLYLMLS